MPRCLKCLPAGFPKCKISAVTSESNVDKIPSQRIATTGDGEGPAGGRSGLLASQLRCKTESRTLCLENTASPIHIPFFGSKVQTQEYRQKNFDTKNLETPVYIEDSSKHSGVCAI